jgi:molybdenum cofactor synthesis domain-containing protein
MEWARGLSYPLKSSLFPREKDKKGDFERNLESAGIMLKIGILTISDKGAQGQRSDESGQVIRESFSSLESQVAKYEIVPDEIDIISRRLMEWADRGDVDVIITTGGTGLSQRDVTPEATLAIVDKVVPGLPEAMRAKTLAQTPMAMLSRATAGVRRECLIVNLPGSPRAVRECLEVILPAIPHAVEIIKGEVTEHS